MRCWSSSAVEALRHDPSCVFLDLGLPDGRGLAALVTILGAARVTPVIVLTGRNDRRFGDEAVAADAQDYLVRDDSTAYLLERAVRYSVERRRAQVTGLAL